MHPGVRLPDVRAPQASTWMRLVLLQLDDALEYWSEPVCEPVAVLLPVLCGFGVSDSRSEVIEDVLRRKRRLDKRLGEHGVRVAYNEWNRNAERLQRRTLRRNVGRKRSPGGAAWHGAARLSGHHVGSGQNRHRHADENEDESMG